MLKLAREGGRAGACAELADAFERRLRSSAGTFRRLACGALACLAVAQVPHASRAQQTSPDPATLVAAHDLVLTLGLDRQLNQIIDLVAKGRQNTDPSGGGRARFLEILASKLPLIREETAALYARRFSAAELTTLTAFFRAGPGAKFLAVSSDLQRDATRVGLKYSREALVEAEAAAGK